MPPTATIVGLDDKERIRIDMAPIRREMLKSMLPDGEFEKLSPEERQRVVAEVNQRMMGIAQGIRLGATEIQKRVSEAQREAAEANRTTAEANTRVVTIGPAKPATAAAPVAPPALPEVAPAPAPKSTTTPRTPEPLRTPEPQRTPPTTRTPVPEAPAKPASPALPPPAPAAPGPSSTQRKMAITGSKFDVSIERDGKVVNQVNAEINLPALMQTVFGTTRRDRGEVPFAVAKDGQIYTQLADDQAKVRALGAAAKPDSVPGTFVTKDWVTVTTADPTGSGLKFGIARPVGDSMSELRRTTARNAGFGLGFIGLALIGIVPLSARLTKNLSSLSDGVKRIAEGDYRARVPVRSQDEIGKLAMAFNQMAEDVEKHQRAAVEQERIKRELELGRQIQHDMLPQGALHLGLTEIKGVSVPAREVGGDFFNYFQLSSGQIAMLVGDVSGKGVGAALLMANIQAALRTRLSMLQDLASLARELDADIEASTPGPVYATLFVGILDPATRVLRYVNAGHHPQFVLKKDHSLERMSSTGLPIGLYAGRGYTEDRVQLTAGDVLFFYTDGCVEAESESGDMFGAERLEKLLSSISPDGADDLLVKVEAAVAEFRGAREPFDDATMMAVKVG
jgi:serine phosphatase RsbU (regulator of sigma subunit)